MTYQRPAKLGLIGVADGHLTLETGIVHVANSIDGGFPEQRSPRILLLRAWSLEEELGT